MLTRRFAPLRLALAALYALVMVVIGVAHETGAGIVAAPAAAAVAGFVLPDGSVAAICGHVDDLRAAGTADPHAGHPGCDLCVLAMSAGLGALSAPAVLPDNRVIARFVLAEAATLTPMAMALPGARGPPA